jgi:hypothetical protein
MRPFTALPILAAAIVLIAGGTVLAQRPDGPEVEPVASPATVDAPDDGLAASGASAAPSRSTDAVSLPADSALLVWDWDFPDRQAMLDAGMVPTTYGPENGIAEPVELDEPGPWGTVHALRNTFYPMPRTTQPQVGMRRDFGEYLPRLWLRTWIRFSPNWTVYPTWRNPQQPDQETGNTDHKTMFVFAMDPERGPWDDWDRRWDIKFGPNGSSCVASGGFHANANEAYYEVGHFPAQGRFENSQWNEMQAVSHLRCDANTAVWDGEWHQLEAYMEITPTPTLQVWLDDRIYIDSTLSGMLRARPEHRFWSIWFGGNRNSGPAEEMWFEYGPAYVFDAPPPEWPAG